MKILFWGTTIFTSLFFFQLALWKIRLPQRQIKTILIIFFGGLAASLPALACLPADFRLIGAAPPQGPAEFLSIALLVTALILSYMITYTALEADSPSLVMAQRIAAADGGLSQEAFEAGLSDGILILPRVKDLLTDKMAKIEGGRYRLTPKGRLMAEIFIFHRTIMGLGKGG